MGAATAQLNVRIDPVLKKSGNSNRLSLGECELARMMRSRFDDFEDNLIVAAANTANADHIVTNDRGMLERMPKACITPERAVELVELRDPPCT